MVICVSSRKVFSDLYYALSAMSVPSQKAMAQNIPFHSLLLLPVFWTVLYGSFMPCFLVGELREEKERVRSYDRGV